MAIGFLYSEALKEYDFGPGHPFRGDRYEIFPTFLRGRLPEDDNYRFIAAKPATDEDLLLVCERDYIDFTREYYKAANLGLSYHGQLFKYHSGDNMPVGRPGKVEEAARLIIGQTRKACDLVQSGEFKKAVSIGGGMHHAKASYGEGFCIYNDVAFCALYLMRDHGLDRVMILDTDAHAGNGTSEYFFDDSRVLFVDMHQDPSTLYPGTGFAHQIGAGEGMGFNVNLPMPPFAGYDSYKHVFEALVEPLARDFQPQIIIRNGGSDPHANDGLTSLGLPVSGFKMIGEKIRGISALCGDRHIDLIASGYNKTVLPYAWLALLSGVAGFDVEVEEPEAISERFRTDEVLRRTERMVEEVRGYLKDYWACMR